MKKLTGSYSTTANNTKSYEIYHANSQILPVVAALLQANFGFEPQPLIDGFDVYYLDCIREDCRLTISWDCWSGCSIMNMSASPNWDQIIEEIGAFLDKQLQNLDDYFDLSLLPKPPE